MAADRLAADTEGMAATVEVLSVVATAAVAKVVLEAWAPQVEALAVLVAAAAEESHLRRQLALWCAGGGMAPMRASLITRWASGG